MAQTTMRADFLQPLQVLAQFTFHAVGQHLRVFAVDDVALAIQEPGRDLVLRWVVDYCYDAFEFFAGYFAGAAGGVRVEVRLVGIRGEGEGRKRGKRGESNKPFIQINIRLLTDQIRVAASHALDLRERVHDLLLAVDIGIEETEDELEV